MRARWSWRSTMIRQAASAAQTWVRRRWRVAAAVPGTRLARRDLPARDRQLAGDGRTLAVYDYSAGRAQLQAIETARSSRPGSAALRARPAAGSRLQDPNVALTRDGGKLLLGSLNHACGVRRDGVRAAASRSCSSARAEAGSASRRSSRHPASPAASSSASRSPSMRQAPSPIVGGTGQPGRAGALGRLQPWTATSLAWLRSLRPEKRLNGFAADLALSGDGRWLAVGGDQSVHLYELRGGRVRTCAPGSPRPTPTAGYFGETVALSADGRRLLTGAPRTDCAEGVRCGVAYRLRLWPDLGASPEDPARDQCRGCQFRPSYRAERRRPSCRDPGRRDPCLRSR